ncbi:hypothetical protein K488DRAFT_86994 [Vararia minispora EC-137]|uniref:Uncharacterized protein n=1 Tax=Vararia minispora EC-137 TaxID=1314806 RepID=A0ACB8QIW6_9AGAM|nr:hypothetical protein K488DRAFT_86994 [Vararia minispora EC-137]
MTPPIIPRFRRIIGQGKTEQTEDINLKTVATTVIQTRPVKIEDDGVSLDHLAIVEGWETFAIPTSPLIPSTPSLANSGSDVDELLLPSPYTSPPHRVQEFSKAKLDDYIIPRGRLRRANGQTPLLRGVKQSLNQYLRTVASPKIVSIPKSEPSSPYRCVTSIVDQASLAPQARLSPCRPPTSDDDDFDQAVRKLYDPLGECFDPVLREQPADKVTEMMEVPLLSEPSVHVRYGVAPESLQSLVRILRPVRGIKPLNIELSWRPFDFQDKMPTHDDIARTNGLHELISSADPDAIDQRVLRDVLQQANGQERSTQELYADDLQRALAASPTRPADSASSSGGSPGSLPIADYSEDLAPTERGDGQEPFAPLSLDSQSASLVPAYFSQLEQSQSSVFPDGSGLSPRSSEASLLAPREHEAPRQHLVMSSLSQFLEILGRSGVVLQDPNVESDSIERRLASEPQNTGSFVVPAEVINDHTLQLPETLAPSEINHVILASLQLMRDRLVLHAMASPARRIYVSEREMLNGADLALSCEVAVILFPLAHLPSGCNDLKARLDTLSWSFSRILVILESYTGPQGAQYAFTPPVVKAVKRLHRNLTISEAYKTKSADTTISFAYPDTVEKAADFVLFAGEGALGNGWVDDGSWLLNEQDDESSLGSVPGMNAFASAILLSQTSLDRFLSTEPEERLAFSPLVGERRILCLNAWLSDREKYMYSSENDPSFPFT